MIKARLTYPALTLLFVLGISGCDSDQAKLECPQPQPITTTSVIKETAADIEELQQRLTNVTQDNAVNEIIFGLKKKYPKATSAEISNYLTTAYCPVIAKENRPLDEAKARIEQFNAQVRQTLAE